MPHTRQSKLKASQSYLNNHDSRVRPEDIVEKFPGTKEGGYAIVQKARLRTEDGTEKLVALKVLKHGIGGDSEDEESLSTQIKVSYRCP